MRNGKSGKPVYFWRDYRGAKFRQPDCRTAAAGPGSGGWAEGVFAFSAAFWEKLPGRAGAAQTTKAAHSHGEFDGKQLLQLCAVSGEICGEGAARRRSVGAGEELGH